MISKITRLLIVALIVLLAIGAIYLNPAEVTLHYMPGKSITLMSGVIFLLCFGLGLVTSLFFWVLFGIKTYFRERSLKAEEKKSKDFYKSMLEARTLLAADETKRAEDKWQKLIKRDPTDIIARVELSRSLEQGGNPREALKVLDQARASDPTNVEVLLRAAELNISIGNKTAAIDNLALVHYHEPNAYAAKLARDLSEELGRIEDAVEYNEKYEHLVGNRDNKTSARLRFLQLQNEKDTFTEKEYLKKLKKLANSKTTSTEAVLALALQEEEQGNTTEAAEVLIRGAKTLNSRTLWRQAIELWLGYGDLERAIAAGKTAIRDAKEASDTIDATLDVARLILGSGDASSALQLLDTITDQVHDLSASALEVDNERKRSFLILRGAAFSALERHGDEQEIWQALSLDQSPFGNQKGSNVISLHSKTQQKLPAPDSSSKTTPIFR